MLEEPLRHFGDLSVGQSRVGLADVDQPVAVPNGKRVVAKHSDSLSVSVLDRGYDDIERREFALELEPRLTAPPGSVARVEILDHQAFVAAGTSRRKEVFNVIGGVSRRDRSADDCRAGKLL